MHKHQPRVSIGLPIYNGENYLAETLETVLAQTFADYELIILDNASTDATESICREYAQRDKRIRYVRNETNIGAARNYNRVFWMAQGEYFKWAAHDDLFAPTFIERCVDVLDNDPSIIGCFSRIYAIDENSEVLYEYAAKPRLADPNPQDRFYECINVPHPQAAVFGVMRRNILAETMLIGNFSGSDRVLLGELSVRGRLYEIPEFLFSYRNHPQQSWQAFRTTQEYQAWFDPTKLGKISFPHWRLLLEHYLAFNRASGNWYVRFWCYLYLVWWARLHWRFLASNLMLRDITKVKLLRPT